MQNLKKIANALATFGPVGYFPFAGLIAVLLSIPIVMAVNSLVWGFPAIYPFIYVALFLLCVAVLVFALYPEEESLPRSAMMINRVLGLLVVFSGIAINTKLLVIGSIFFLLLRHFIPRLLLRYAAVNFSSWPAFVHLLFIDITAGLAANFIFRFIFWLVAMPR
jgi:hypothetical protein